VPSFAKPILAILGVLAAVYLLAVLVVNIYLQSADVQKRIHEAVSEAAGLPARIDHTYYAPWSGFTISGISLPPAPGSEEPLLAIRSIGIDLGLKELLAGRVLLERVRVVAPAFTAIRRDDAPLIPPPPVEVLPGGEPIPLPVEPLPPTESEPITPNDDAEPLPPPPPPPPAPQVTLSEIVIADGSIKIMDGDLRPVAEVVGISARAQLENSTSARGSFKIERAAFAGFVRPTSITGGFAWTPANVAVTDIGADWAGGRLAGKLDIASIPESHFSATLEASNVSLAGLAADAGIEPDGMEGSLHTTIQLSGAPGEQESWRGGATAHLENAVLQPADLVTRIGDLLGIEELRLLRLAKAQTRLSVASGRIFVEELELASENIAMDAKGSSDFDGVLDLDARLHLGESIRRGPAGLLGNQLIPSEDKPGYAHLPFRITGSMARPGTDLLDKLVGARIKEEVGGFLKGLFGKPPRQEPEQP
jgi:hypothetical protein